MRNKTVFGNEREYILFVNMTCEHEIIGIRKLI